MRWCLYLLVTLHLALVLVNTAALVVLPFTALWTGLPFWYTVFLVTPVESAIVFLACARTPCPLTRLENWLRRRLGRREIGGFIGHYLIKQRWRRGRWRAESATPAEVTP